MSNIIHSTSKDSKQFTKLICHKTKSSSSTSDNSLKIHAIAQISELDSLYQEYVKIKEKRQQSEKYTSKIISKVNYLQKEKDASKTRLQQIKLDLQKKEQSHSYSLDSKARQSLIQSQQEDYLEKQKKKTAVIKSSTDYVHRTWKDQIRVRNESKANKMRLVKFRNEAMKSLSKLNESTHKQEHCVKIKEQRTALEEKREQYLQKIKDDQRKELIKKIIQEQERKNEYDSIISSYREKGQMILSQMEEIPGISPTLFLAQKLDNLPYSNEELDWTLRDLSENDVSNS